MHALLVDPGFAAVGQYYRSFDQTTDHEVIEIFNAAAPLSHKCAPASTSVSFNSS